MARTPFWAAARQAGVTAEQRSRNIGNTTAHLLLLVSVAVWGTLHPISKLLFREGLTPAHLALARLGLATLTMLAITAATGRLEGVATLRRRDLLAVAGLGFCGYFLAIYLSLRGLEYLPASMNSLLANASPLFVALFSPVLAGQRPSRRALLGLLAGFVGVALLLLSRAEAAGGVALLGVLLSLGSSCTWGLYTTLGRWATGRMDPALITLVASAASVPPLAALAVTEGRLGAVPAAPPLAIAGFFWLGVIATGLPFFVWTAALRHLPAASVAAYSYLVPAFGVLFAFLLLGEQPTPLFLLGGALILLGVAAAQR